MNLLRKVLLSSEGRPSRFHTRRGQLMPSRAWVGLPRAAMLRLAGIESMVPWIAPPAVDFLAARIRPEWSVLEFGSGRSTVWFARRVASVVSYEGNLQWQRRVEEWLEAADLTNVTMRTWPLTATSTIPGPLTGDFDVILVDNDEQIPWDRPAILATVAPRVRPGGFLVLDNSDWPSFQVEGLLTGWKEHRFVGLVPRPFQANETTVFQRCDSSR